MRVSSGVKTLREQHRPAPVVGSRSNDRDLLEKGGRWLFIFFFVLNKSVNVIFAQDLLAVPPISMPSKKRVSVGSLCSAIVHKKK